MDADKLAKDLQNGDQSVIPQLVNMCQFQVYKVAFHVTKSPEDAEDITQEVFLQIIKKIEQWSGKNFKAWLTRIAKNQAIDCLRKRNKKLPLFNPQAAKSQDYLVIAEQKKMVNNVLKKLPKGQREIIYLRHFQGFSLKEIAQQRECAEGTVKATLFQAFQKLRNEFQKIGLIEF